jgi:hypothetical protein
MNEDLQIEISHSWQEEEPEAKARWFQSLTLAERMEMLCSFTDLILMNNPTIADTKDDQSTSRRIRVVSKAQS